MGILLRRERKKNQKEGDGDEEGRREGEREKRESWRTTKISQKRGGGLDLKDMEDRGKTHPVQQ